MKKWLIILSLFCMILTIPSMGIKHTIEHSSQTVETVVDYNSLVVASNQGEKPKQEFLSLLDKMKEMHITSIGLPLYSFYDLEKRGMVSVLSGKQLKTQTFGRNDVKEINPDAQYVLLLDNEYEKDIEKVFETYVDKKVYHSYKEQKQQYYEVELSPKELYSIRFEPFQSDVSLLEEKGFHIVTLMSNAKEDGMKETADLLEKWYDEKHSSKIMFQGNEAFGFPDDLKTYQSLWKKYTLVHQEIFNPEARQKGMQTLLEQSEYHGIRAHILGSEELHNEKNTEPVLTERLVKAIHERNMRMLYFGIPNDTPDMVKKDLKKLEKALQHTEKELKAKGYTFGEAQPFEGKDSVWVNVAKYALLVATGLLFMLLVSFYFPIRYAWAGMITYLIGCTGLAFVSSKLLWAIIPFGFAVLFPIMIGSLLQHVLEKKSYNVWHSTGFFIGISLFSVFAATSLTSIFASLPYILYVQQFRGVALAHLIPIVMVAVFLFFTAGRLPFQVIWKLMKTPIRFYHAAILLVVLAFGYYYISRTGNGGTMLPFEAQFRTLLQDLFGIRPRTKEFLFAHPLLLVTIVFWSHQKWVKWLLPIAIIGQISILNTFTHLHTPLIVSLERVLYGILLGVIVGLILVGLIKVVLHFGNKLFASWKEQFHSNQEEK